MNNDDRHFRQRSFWLATGIGLFVLLFFGFEYRMMSRSLSYPVSEKSSLSGILSFIPLDIGNWQGRDIPLDKAVVQAMAVDDYINRSYTHYPESQKVELFITCGERVRDLMPHRPEVCYPGNGWLLRSSEKKLLRMDDGWSFECRILHFDRGGLSDTRMTVLNYYVVDGRYVPDLSAIRSTMWRNYKSMGYMLQVQVACESSQSHLGENATDLAVSFALESVQAIRALLSTAQKPAVASMP
ncbi:MAG: EpsI family protein [Phycisphaerae bacterium]|nr:EpsI family protein [Phycisphaerae bacterium]